jgi:hypothetical protein
VVAEDCYSRRPARSFACVRPLEETIKHTVSALAPVLAALVAGGPAPGAADVSCSYSDPDFGIHTHALDIDTVRVDRSADTLLTFTVGFAKDVALNPDTGFQIVFDGDGDPRTGDPDGFERYVTYVEGESQPNPWLDEWRGGEWKLAGAPSLAFSHADNSVVFEVRAPDLMTEGAFSFRVVAGTGWSDSEDIDVAPEREHVLMASDPGVWTFPACGTIGADSEDGEAFPLGMVALLLFGAGAVVGVSGFVVERVRERRSR